MENNFNLMMLDELLSIYVYKNNELALDEVHKRLEFCNFDSKTIDFIIQKRITF